MWLIIILAVIGYISIGLYVAGNFAWCFGVSHSSIRPWWSLFLVPALILGWPVFGLYFTICILVNR